MCIRDRVFDSSIKVAETENVFMEYLNNAEEQYRSKLKEITLERIIKVAHKVEKETVHVDSVLK